MVVLCAAALLVSCDELDVPEKAVIMHYCRPVEQVKQTLAGPLELWDYTHTPRIKAFQQFTKYSSPSPRCACPQANLTGKQD